MAGTKICTIGNSNFHKVPIESKIILNIYEFEGEDFETIVTTVIHEAIHGLGFSKVLFQRKDMYPLRDNPEGGYFQILLGLGEGVRKDQNDEKGVFASPGMIQLVQEHFNCHDKDEEIKFSELF